MAQVAAVEVLLNSKHIQELIVSEMDRSRRRSKSLSPGSEPEQALFKFMPV
jgi:hypothetical protein